MKHSGGHVLSMIAVGFGAVLISTVVIEQQKGIVEQREYSTRTVLFAIYPTAELFR